MEPQKNIKDIFCPECGQSLIFPNPGRKTKVGEEVKTKIFLTKEGKTQNLQTKKRTFLSDLKVDEGTPFDRVLFFLIVASNNRSGFLELSIIPGDYSKYASIELYPEEEITCICPHCHKAISKDGFVKVLVEFKSKKDGTWEYFLSARYGVEITLYQKDGKIGLYCGDKFKNAAQYLKQKLRKINSRKGIWGVQLAPLFCCAKIFVPKNIPCFQTKKDYYSHYENNCFNNYNDYHNNHCIMVGVCYGKNL